MFVLCESFNHFWSDTTLNHCRSAIDQSANVLQRQCSVRWRREGQIIILIDQCAVLYFLFKHLTSIRHQLSNINCWLMKGITCRGFHCGLRLHSNCSLYWSHCQCNCKRRIILKLDIAASMKSARWQVIFLLGKIEPVEREGDGGTELLFEPIALWESLQVDD